MSSDLSTLSFVPTIKGLKNYQIQFSLIDYPLIPWSQANLITINITDPCDTTTWIETSLQLNDTSLAYN